jgi:hypothetical protein
VGQAIRAELVALLAAQEQDSRLAPEAEAIARAQMGSLDAHVQAAALALLTRFPPSAENLSAIRSGLQNSPDALLIEQAMPELERYLGTPWEEELHALLTELVRSGAHFSSQAAAERILPFLRTGRADQYQKVLEALPTQSKAAQLLRAALAEWERIEGGA